MQHINHWYWTKLYQKLGTCSAWYLVFELRDTYYKCLSSRIPRVWAWMHFPGKEFELWINLPEQRRGSNYDGQSNIFTNDHPDADEDDTILMLSIFGHKEKDSDDNHISGRMVVPVFQAVQHLEDLPQPHNITTLSTTRGNNITTAASTTRARNTTPPATPPPGRPTPPPTTMGRTTRPTRGWTARHTGHQGRGKGFFQ